VLVLLVRVLLQHCCLCQFLESMSLGCDVVLLGCDVVKTRTQMPAFRRNILSLSSGLKMETVCFSETLVFTYESTRRHNPEQHYHLHRRQNLKFHDLGCVLITGSTHGETSNQ
jgi:hypothetical protein